MSGALTRMLGRSAAAAVSKVRNTSIQHVNNANNATVTWPAGAQAGDTVFLFTGHGFTTTLPTGFTNVGSTSQANWNGRVCYRTLNSTDISTGSISVSFAGTYYGVIWAVCCIGAPTLISTGSDLAGNTSGSTSRAKTTAEVVNSGDTLLYFGSGRLTNLSVTCDRGTQANTINANTNAGGSGYTEIAPSSFPSGVTSTWTFSSSPTGDFYGQVVLR